MSRTIRFNYQKNPHQQIFHDDYLTKFLYLSSGFGGGKSYAIAMKIFHLSYINRNIPGGIVCPSLPDYKKDLWPLIEEILEVNNIRYKYHQTDKWFKFPWSKSKIQVVSAEKKIRGPNWGWAVINEVGLIPWDRMQDVIGRVRIKNTPYPQIAMSGTPEGTGHWTYEKLVEKPLPNSKIIYGDTRDNIMNLADDYISTLEGSYDKLMLDAYLKGLFVNLIGNLFYYAYDPHKVDDKSIVRDPEKEVHVSMDFNVDPMCATLWNMYVFRGRNGMTMYDREGLPMKQMRAFDQINLSGPAGADTAKMSDALFAYGLTTDDTIIYPDPAGKHRSTQGLPDVIQLQNAGWTIRVKNAAPQFRKRQLAHNNLLSKNLVKIHPVKCKGMKTDYQSVAQDPATYEKIKKNVQLTHFSDGTDYMFDILFPLSGRKPTSKSVRYR